VGKSAGTFRTLFSAADDLHITWERAWQCTNCPVSWYKDCGADGDDTKCPRCGSKGEPDKLPDGAELLEMPDQ
jgi:hypothetical protein